MPTTRPRHRITKTPALARAIDLAAERWPGEPRSKLLLRLVEAGRKSLLRSAERAERDRQEAILASSGAYSDAYDKDYLTELGRDRPA